METGLGRGGWTLIQMELFSGKYWASRGNAVLMDVVVDCGLQSHHPINLQEALRTF